MRNKKPCFYTVVASGHSNRAQPTAIKKRAWKSKDCCKSCQKPSWTTEQFSFINADFAHICYKGIPSPYFWYLGLSAHLCAQAERKQDWGRLKRSMQGLPLTASTELWGTGKNPQAKPAKHSWIRTNTNSSSPTLPLPHKHVISHLAAVCQLPAGLCWWGFTVQVLVCSLQAQFPENSWEVPRKGVCTVSVKATLMEPNLQN